MGVSLPDVVIIGGGPVGATLGIAIAAAGGHVVIVDKAPSSAILESTSDIRGFALAESSKVLLEHLGIWSEFSDHAEPILDIKITNGASSVALDFIEENGAGDAAPMGYIVEAFRVRQAVLRRALKEPNITWHDGTSVAEVIPGGEDLTRLTLSNGIEITTPLLVAADGKNSSLRELYNISTTTYPYDQKALVCTLSHDNAHHGVAYEKFYQGGPFATLPMTENRSALVWSERPDVTDLLLEMNEKEFVSELQSRIGSDYHGIQLASQRQVYPLSLQVAHSYIAPRFALVGDAAHVIHPLSGQGLNLGLRDAAALAEIVVDAIHLGLDVGSKGVLKRYQQWRRFDQLSLVAVTHGLSRIFSNPSRVLQKMRGAGLKAFQKVPGVKKIATRHAMGLLGDLPKLLRGISLEK